MFGLLAVTRAVLPTMGVQKSGVIVNISSIGGQMTFSFMSLHHGTKCAVEGISEVLAYEVASFGRRVKSVDPGSIKTDFAGRSMDFKNDPGLAEYQPMIGKQLEAMRSTAGQGSDPRVVAKVIWQVVTDDSDRLRLTANEEAKVLLVNRKARVDATFTAGVKAMFRLLGRLGRRTWLQAAWVRCPACGPSKGHSAKKPALRLAFFIGAGEGIRTLDPNLGKVMLYP